MSDAQEILDKKWFYNRARTCPIIHRCIMEHEHQGLSWPSTLALMVKYLSEANENKDNIIAKTMELTLVSPSVLLKDIK